MTDTINVPIITPGTWQAVTTAGAGGASGVASIAGNGQHCIHTGLPATSLVGHRFKGDIVPFSLVEGESLCVKADTATTIIITED